MFLCDPCATKMGGAANLFSRSHGPCESCKKPSDCSDVHTFAPKTPELKDSNGRPVKLDKHGRAIIKKRKPVKCQPGKLCSTLFDRAEAGNFGKGFRILTIFNMKTGKERILVSYRRDGTKAEKGIILNLCPFCGGKLHNEKV
jgi:hypothetical protein